MTLRLTMLPAGEGDALHLTWGPAEDRRQLMIDMGVHATGRAFRQRIKALPVAERHFDLLVVTHVDTDHIYGVLSALVDADPIEGLDFDDVWFNGWTHLNGGRVAGPADADEQLAENAHEDLFGTSLESYGGRQGEEFSIWLRGQPWNRAFQGGPVACPEGAPGPTFKLAHGLELTILGPTAEQLARLKPEWRKAVGEALRKQKLDADDVHEDLVPEGLEPMGKKRPGKPRLSTTRQLEKLADAKFKSDSRAANGSSIALLARYEGNSILFAGDAHPGALVEALGRLFPDTPPELAAFKLPHHGSKNNVSRELIEAVRCNHWLISTNGVKHYHPDAEAVARVLKYARPTGADSDQKVLLFNEPSRFNTWWQSTTWQGRFGYSALYGDEAVGLTLEVSANKATVV